MAKYRKKPVEIEAWPVAELLDAMMDDSHSTPFHELFPAVAEAASYGSWEWYPDRRGIVIATLEGRMFANPDDMIIRGVEGEFYPCKPGIFAESYERVGE